MDINEIIKSVFENDEKQIHELSQKQLLELHKYFQIQIKGRSKYLLIKQLMPIKLRYQRIRQVEESNFTEECPICYDAVKPNEYIVTRCCHLFCQKCIVLHMVIGKNKFCPYCRTKCKINDIITLPITNEELEKMGILKITPDILDSGIIILEHFRYQQYITDPNIISEIRNYQERQQQYDKIVNKLIHICLFIIIGWIFKNI